MEKEKEMRDKLGCDVPGWTNYQVGEYSKASLSLGFMHCGEEERPHCVGTLNTGQYPLQGQDT